MKSCKRILQYTAALFLTGVLIFSCDNFFSLDHSKGSKDQEPKETTGTVNIALANKDARTIYPDTPKFEKFRLEFSHATSGHEPLTIDSSYTSIELEAGNWTITAYGQLTFNGELTDVAQGSTEVTVSEGSSVTTSIVIKSSIEGGPGSFSWSIAAPLGVEADSWSITLTEYDSEEDPVLAESYDYDGSSTALSKSGTLTCDPGYYVLSVIVGDNKQRASRTEIVHIHSGLVSTANFTFTQENFIKLISLSGTFAINTSEGSLELDYADITVSEKNNKRILSSASIEQDGSWNVLIEAKTEPAPVIFHVDGNVADGSLFSCNIDPGLSIMDVDIQGINLNQSMIYLEGTVASTINGEPISFNHFNVYLYDSSDDNSICLGEAYGEDDGSWSMLVPSSEPFYPEFRVNGSTSDSVYFNYTFKEDFTIGSEDKRDIELMKNQVTISGTIELNVDGIPQEWDYCHVNIRKVGQSDYIGYNSADEDGYWEVAVDVQEDSVPICIFISVIYNNSSINYDFEGDWFLSDTPISGIELTCDYISVSGTVEISVDHEPLDPDILYIIMYNKDTGNYLQELYPRC